MKTSVFILFCALCVFQATYAFPQLRFRREVKHDLNLSPDAQTKRAELLDYAIQQFVDIAKDSVANHKRLYTKFLKDIKNNELKSNDLNEQIEKFSNLLERAKALPAPKTDDDMEKLFNVFSDMIDLSEKYDDIENPTAEEKLIKNLLDENGAPSVAISFFVDFLKIRKNYETHIQKYFDSISEDDKAKDDKFLKWFEKLKTTHNVEKSIDVTMEIFEHLETDDSDEKTE